MQEPAAEDNSEPDKKEQEPAADDNCEPDKKEEDLAAAENTQQDQNYKESLKIGWHPTNRWVLAHGPQLPSQKSWGNSEWNCDSFGWWSWRLKFYMSQEKNFAAEEDAITGTVSRDGSLIDHYLYYCHYFLAEPAAQIQSICPNGSARGTYVLCVLYYYV